MRHGGGTSQKQTLDAHLAHRYAADAGVQEPRGGVGTHFAHEGEFLFPADTVFLHFFSVRKQRNTVFKHRYKAKSVPLVTFDWEHGPQSSSTT